MRCVGDKVVYGREMLPSHIHISPSSKHSLGTQSIEDKNINSNGNSRIIICTLSSAYWQKASKHSALWRFELIWKDGDKCAYQYNTVMSDFRMLCIVSRLLRWIFVTMLGLVIDHMRHGNQA